MAVAGVIASGNEVVRLAGEIEAICPLEGLEQLTRLRETLIEVLEASTESEEAARVLLNLVTTRQSRVARSIEQLWADRADAFTPWVIRSLGGLGTHGRTVGELRPFRVDCRVDAEAADQQESGHRAGIELVSRALLEAGFVSRLAAQGPDACDQALFRLTPAGARILPVIASRVLDRELGCYAWPEGVTSLDTYADQQHLKVLRFERNGCDGRNLEQFLDMRQGQIGSLSVPEIRGVGRPRSGPGTEAQLHSFALLYKPSAVMDVDEALSQAIRIADNQRSLASRVKVLPRFGDLGVTWTLTLFVSSDLQEAVGKQVADVFEERDVTVELVA